MNLQESIRRILREEVKQLKDMLKPANPEGVLHHHTTYKFRESIQKNGLLPKVGKQTANYMSYNFPDSEPLPMIFASDPEYGFFGGDVWEIDLSKINNTWYNDPIHEGDGNNFKYYVTLDPIPPSAIKLISSDEQRDNDLDTFRETGKFPNRNPEPEEPKTPEEPSKWGDLISQVGDDDTISMDDLFNLKESVRRILKEEVSTETKYLIYIYFCDYSDSRIDDFISKFNDMDINFWVKPGKGHHTGFAIQSILDTHSLKIAKQTSKHIYETFDDDILIVLSKQQVSNIEPIGVNNEEVFTEPGRYFDKLVKKKEKGIYII